MEPSRVEKALRWLTCIPLLVSLVRRHLCAAVGSCTHMLSQRLNEHAGSLRVKMMLQLQSNAMWKTWSCRLETQEKQRYTKISATFTGGLPLEAQSAEEECANAKSRDAERSEKS